MTKSLTEKWKDETLKGGFYWLKVDVGGGEYIDIVEYDEDYCDFIRYWDDCIKEVLAPVPSYEEYKEMDNDLNEIASKNDSLAMECGKLQEQLAIATKALKHFKEQEDTYLDYGLDENRNYVPLHPSKTATNALKEIKEVI